MHCGATFQVGWPDAAHGDQTPEGKCRSGHVIGLALLPQGSMSHSPADLQVYQETGRNQLRWGCLCTPRDD